MKPIIYDLITIAAFIIIGFLTDCLVISFLVSILYLLIVLCYNKSYTDAVEKDREYWQNKHMSREKDWMDYL